MTALGGVAAGLFCTDDRLQGTLLAAANVTGEKLWPMPLFPENEKTLSSEVADFKHTGGAYSGVGSSAMFLKQFTDYPAWAHIDMAGLASGAKDNPYLPNGATGFGTRLLTEFAVGWSRSGK
jgi:leucyl aminopeptidase